MSPQTSPQSPLASAPRRSRALGRPAATRVGAAVAVGLAAALTIGGLTAANAAPRFHATASYRTSASATSAGSAVRSVTASATAGSPPVVRSKSAVAKVVRYASASKTATVRVTASAGSRAAAERLAASRARTAAKQAAARGAADLARARAIAAAKAALLDAIRTLWAQLYAHAVQAATAAANAPTSTAPTSTAPTSTAPTSTTPTSTTPTSTTPTSTTPTSTTPTSTTPTSTTPTSTTPTSTTPTSTTPTSSAPTSATVTAPLTSTVNAVPEAAATQPCGTTTFTDTTGTTYTCSFDDEFSGDTLDTTKWTTWNNINWWGDSSICYYDDSNHIAVSNGALNLSVTRMPASSSCLFPNGTPTYGGAVIHTKDTFSQTYGIFSARIKFGGGYGVHDAYWLYPEDSSTGDHAEIDVAEPYGAIPGLTSANTHEINASGADGGAMNWCNVPNWADDYHVYTAKWTPTAITFYVDGNLCGTYSGWQPMAGKVAPAPFNRDFYMILEASVDNGMYAPAPTSSTSLPSTTSVDWVRVWKAS